MATLNKGIDEFGNVIPMSDAEEAAFLTQQAIDTPSLGQAQAKAIAAMTSQCQQQIAAVLDPLTIVKFLKIYTDAMFASPQKKAQAAYCQQVDTWGTQCYQALQQAIASVQTATDAAGVAAVTLTLPAAPAVTLAGAMAITN